MAEMSSLRPSTKSPAINGVAMDIIFKFYQFLKPRLHGQFLLGFSSAIGRELKDEKEYIT